MTSFLTPSTARDESERNAAVAVLPIGSFVLGTQFLQQAETYSVFGQATYHFTDEFRAIEWLNRKRGLPAIVYLHPWELDPDQPMIRRGLRNTFRHRVNLDRTEQRLDELCRRFELAPIRKVLGV